MPIAIMTIRDQAKKTIDGLKMLSPGDTVLVGVSGGPDSMALLYLLMDIKDEYGITLKIAHLDHGFRKEAAEEAEFVRESAASLGIEAIVRFIDVPSIREGEGLSSQEAAREARYAFFEEAAEEAGASKVALAHTFDDQVETFLIRLLRGSGPLGLSGMPPVREISGQKSGVRSRKPIIIRPLIDCSRKEIETYLSDRNIPFVTDSSNLKMDYMRNRIRMELIPFLESYNPNVKETLVRTSELIHKDNQFLEMEADKIYKTFSLQSVDAIIMDVKSIEGLHQAMSSRVIRNAIEGVKGDLKRISFQHIADILDLMDMGEGRWTLHLPDVTVSREHGKLLFKRGRGRR